MEDKLIKRETASDLILTLMLWGVSSVILTRVFLKITNNPMLVFGRWHIAHVLWGGMLMLIAMLLVLALEGNKIRKLGAAMFGIGWGLFIDEIGKYLTRDNNYWFRPAIIFIYISFVGIFLIYRYLERLQAKSVEEVEYEALNKFEEMFQRELTSKEKKKLLTNLEWLSIHGRTLAQRKMAVSLIDVVKKIKTKNFKIKRDQIGWLKYSAENIFRVTYNRFFRRKVIVIGLWAYSIYFAVDKIVDILRISTSPQKLMMIQRFYEDYNFFGKSDIYMIVLKMVFDLLAAILFLLGARYYWSKKRNRGIRFFKYGLLVSIFFVSIIRFYFEQFSGIYELLFSIILLELLNQHRKELSR